MKNLSILLVLGAMIGCADEPVPNRATGDVDVITGALRLEGDHWVGTESIQLRDADGFDCERVFDVQAEALTNTDSPLSLDVVAVSELEPCDAGPQRGIADMQTLTFVPDPSRRGEQGIGVVYATDLGGDGPTFYAEGLFNGQTLAYFREIRVESTDEIDRGSPRGLRDPAPRP